MHRKLLLLISVGLVLTFARPHRVDAAPSSAPLPAASMPPSPVPSPARVRQAQPRSHALQRFWVGDEAGFPRRVFYTVEPAVYFFATALPRPSRPAGGSAPQAQPSTDATRGPVPSATPLPHFEIRVRDPRGREVARLGGDIPSALDTARADLPRDCEGAPCNGIRIAETSLASCPGRYLAMAFIDDAPVGELWFTVKPLASAGQIVLTSAAAENAEGQRRLTFTPADQGVYAHVTFVNATLDVAHEHLVQVSFEGPQGRVGRTLGGVLRVGRGMRLDGRDFPALCDAEHHDGLRIASTTVAALKGAWKMTVSVDGRPVREVPFRISATRPADPP